MTATRRTGRAAAAAATLASTGLAAGLALGGCASAPPQPPPATVTIGLLTGDGDAPGDDAVRGAELAVEVVNEAHPQLATALAAGAGLPNLDGAALTVQPAGTGGRADAADAALAELLAADRLAGIVADDRTDVVEVAAAYADRRQVPIVDGATTAGYLLDIGHDWYFRTGPTDRTLAGAVLALIPPESADGRSHRITVLTPDDRRGAATAALVGELAETAGFEATGNVATGDGMVPRLATAAPDIVIAVAPERHDGPDLHRALDEWAADPLLADPAVLAVGLGPGFAGPVQAGQTRPGMLYAAAWSAELAGRQPLSRGVAALYQERYQAPMTEVAARAFTTVLTLATAVDAAGTTEPAGVRSALRQLSIPATATIMPWDGIRFGDTGQNELATAVVEQAGTDAVRLIHPPEMAGANLVWETPPPVPGL